MTKIGTGTLVLVGNSTYSGGTTVNNGTLTLGSTSGAAIVGSLTINAGATVKTTVANVLGYNAGADLTVVTINGGSLELAGNGNETSACAFNMTGGTFSSNGISSYVDAGVFQGQITSFSTNASTATALISSNIRLRGDTTSNVNFTVVSGTAPGGVDLLVSGVIYPFETAGITKAGPGLMELTGANTYNGGTIISGGTLQMGNASALGAVTGALNVNSGVLDLQTFSPTVGLLSGSAGTVLANSSGATPTLTVNLPSGTSTFGGTIANGLGTVAFTTRGNGTQILTGSNTYAGPTTISGGTLQLGNGGASGSINNTSGVTDNGTLAFNRSDSPTFALAVSGSGGLRQSGQGTLTLTAANTYSGPTTINGGTLQLGNGGTTRLDRRHQRRGRTTARWPSTAPTTSPSPGPSAAPAA